MKEITIKIRIPDEFDNELDMETLDAAVYKSTLDLVEELQLCSIVAPNGDHIGPSCDVIYIDNNGEYDTPGQYHEVQIP